MDRAQSLLQKFAVDAQKSKVPKDKLRFGAPWRHPPKKDDPCLHSEWAKLQLMDFIQCLVNAEFGVIFVSFTFFVFAVTFCGCEDYTNIDRPIHFCPFSVNNHCAQCDYKSKLLQ